MGAAARPFFAAPWLATPRAALAQSCEPVLRIEAETHTAAVHDAAADVAGRVLVTASDDKTARVWSLPDLRLLGVLRPPIGEGDDGKVYAVAVSPDRRMAAVGGFTGPGADEVNVYTFDLATLSIVHRFAGLPDAVSSLAFAPDGRLAAGLLGHNGIRVWRDGALQFQDADYAALVHLVV